MWGVSERKFYLLDVIREQIEAPELRHLIRATHCRYKADATIIEDDGVGRAIAQDLWRTARDCRPLAARPRYEKLARMEARAAMFETGQVHLPRSAE